MEKIIFVVLLAVLLASCTASKINNSNASSPNQETIRQSENLLLSKEKTFEEESKEQERIVIYNSYITLEVKNPDSNNIRLAEIAKKYDGYVQTLGNRVSIIRVKSDKLYEAIDDIAETGKIKSKTISGDDVTEHYTDIQIRLENAHNARKRYLELLEKAENVEAALKVEKELERLNGEIDSFEGKLKRLKHLSDYSTITINMEEKVKPGILGYIGLGIYKSIKWLFVRN